MTKTPAPTPVPSTLDWDLWLGTAAARPFTAGDQDVQGLRGRAQRRAPGAACLAARRRPGAPAGAPPAAAAGQRAAAGGGMGNNDFGYYLPFNWRGFYDFGSSLIGDWGVHILGPANWGLFLTPEHLVSVECIKKDPLPPDTFPDVFTIKYEFKARNGMPPVTVYWYQAHRRRSVPAARHDGRAGPQDPEHRPAGRGSRTAGPARARAAAGGGGQRAAAAGAGAAGAPGAARPQRAAACPQQGTGYNCIFVGSKGYMGTSGAAKASACCRASAGPTTRCRRSSCTRSPGHIRDWIRACKGGAPACSEFEIAAPYTEWLVLGSAAVRVNGKLLYDAKTGLFTNSPEANKYLQLNYRKGWEVKL